MSRVRTKRGWIERVLLAFVTVLAIGTGIVWIGSCYRSAYIEVPVSQKSAVILTVYVGEVRVEYGHGANVRVRIHIGAAESSESKEPYWWMRAPINKGQIPIPPIPFWMIILVLAPWPMMALYAWLTRRYPPGHCPACGYDLRGSKGSATCPECGEVISEGSEKKR